VSSVTDVDSLVAALNAAPADLDLRLRCAAALAEAGRIDRAIHLLAEGARFHAGNPRLSAKLARLLSVAGLADQAERVLHAGIAAAPDDRELRLQLAAILTSDLRFDAALAELAVALRLAPDNPDVHCNIGLVRQAQRDLPAAIKSYRRALAASPDSAQIHLNLATALLTGGEFTRGFAELEWRLRLADAGRRPPPPLPRWQGEALDGRRLLVTAEQGHGDQIQFARFLPALQRFGGRVVVECTPGLRRLFDDIPGVAETVVQAGVSTGADLTLPLLSLPHVLGGMAAAQPLPYLSVPPGVTVPIPPSDGLKVGLVWSGRRNVRGTAFIRQSLTRRSCPFELLARLLVIDGIAFYSLQVDDDPQRLDRPAPLPQQIHDLAPTLDDFADTAAAMAQLDLIISVDTASAHLAGALGRPLWVMLGPGQADYRWGTGERSPWYPQARLFRCDEGGWPPTIARLADALQTMRRERCDRRPVERG
jgi:tetratricopeptide (TPR) repeat protein